MSSQNRESSDMKTKSTTENLQKALFEVTKTNPLPFIKKGIDSYMNERKTKKKKLLKIDQSSDNDSPNNSQTQIKRYDQIYQSIAEIYKRQEYKKRIVLSSNKILPHEKLMQYFEPYKKQLEKLRVCHNILPFQEAQIEETAFGLAIQDLGIFSHFESICKNKMIPLKHLNSINRSVPKKTREKLKPISESSIKVEQVKKDNGFFNVEKINLIEGDNKARQQSLQQKSIFLGNISKLNKQKQQTETSRQQNYYQRLRELKKYKQYKMNPHLFIKKLEKNAINDHSQREKTIESIKCPSDSINSIFKFYPQVKSKLKTKILTSKQNFTVLSYPKPINSINSTSKIDSSFNATIQLNQLQEHLHSNISQTLADSKTNISKLITNSKLKEQEKEVESQTQKQTSVSEPNHFQPTTSSPVQPHSILAQGSSPVARLNRRKKFFQQLPFQTYFYRDLLWKVNYSNQLFVQTPLQYEHRLKVFIGKGNNSSMIVGLIKRRIWFAITDKVEEANFVWTQLKVLPYYKKQQPASVLHPRKQNSELKKYQTKYLYEGKILNNQENQTFKSYFQTYINFEQKSDERFINRQKSFQYRTTIKSNEIRSLSLQNHLINNYVIGNKKALFNTMSNYYTERGDDVFQYLPLTFHIKNGLEDDSWYNFLKYYYKRGKQIKLREGQNSNKNDKEYNAWIVKPGENSNRGNGIQMCLSLEQIKAIVKQKQIYSDGSSKTFIIQSYIERPLLYYGRKFDIRHYMMITSINGLVKGYFYRDGYIRTTSTEYSLKTNCGNIHLTNDAVQKNLPDYGKYQKGNKISYDQLSAYMAKHARNKGFDFWGKIYPRMKKIATDVMRACSGGIDPEKLQNNFEVFGMDFMIDSEYNVWLIEVNSNPCLQLSCPLLGSIIPRMVENALQLTMDGLFPPPVRFSPKGLHYYKNLQNQNRFQLVYDERIDGLSMSSLNVLNKKMLYEEDDTFEDDGEEWNED